MSLLLFARIPQKAWCAPASWNKQGGGVITSHFRPPCVRLGTVKDCGNGGEKSEELCKP